MISSFTGFPAREFYSADDFRERSLLSSFRSPLRILLIMAKTKSKEVAASDVPSDLEETTGNVAESAPPMLINTREDTPMVVDTAEEDAKEESKENGKEDSVGTDVPEGEKVDEGDKTLEVKATEEVKGDEKGKSTSKKKGKVLSKRKTKAVINAAASREKKEASASAAASSEKTTMVVDTAEEDAKEESKENEKVDSVGTDVPEGEKVDEGDKTLEVKATEEVKGDEKGKVTSKKKGKVLRKRKTKAVINAAASSEKKEASASAGVSDEKPKEKPNGTDQPETPTVDTKKLKMADGMGLIFMCNSKTKKDCFRYKILGLPASKKEMVEKVYKGMRLFLFDIDLKLMYGIYEAASPGGYNLEPKAFKSAFPSQVRFTVLNDCLPLPEEKFKAAIKENYYGRNKFNCQLSVKQQRSLCKLFKRAGKVPSSSKKSREAIRAEPGPRSADRGRKRSRAEAEPSYTERDRKRRSRAEPESSSADRDRKRRPLHERERANRAPPRIRGRDLYSRREAYASSPPRRVAYASPPSRPVAYASPPSRPVAYGSPPRMVARLPPLPLPSYGYDRPVDDYYYRREPLLSAEPRDHRIMNVVDTRAREPIEHRNPYALYREPHLYREAPYAPASLPSMSYAPHSYAPY